MKAISETSSFKVMASVLLTSVVAVGCQPTAKLENVKLCEFTQGETCENDTTNFVRNTKKLFLTANLVNVPEATQLKIDWKYKGDPGKEIVLESTTFNTQGKPTSAQFTFLPKRLHEGTYQVVVSAEGSKIQEISKEFIVVGTQAEIDERKSGLNISTAKLENVKMCEKPKQGFGCETDTINFTRITPKIYVTADLTKASTGTKVKYNWRYVAGEAGQEIEIDSLSYEIKEKENLVNSSLSIPNQGWPTGTYEVILSLDSQNSAPIRREFFIK